MQNQSSILTCELYAIYLSICFTLEKFRNRKTIIFTDSLSAVQSLNSPHLSKHHLTLKIANIVSDLPKGKIEISWIPSHMGITGNENADRLAKESLNLPITSKIKYTAAEASRIARNQLLREFQKSCSPCPHPTDISFSLQKIPPRFLLTPRKIQTIHTRLHLKTTFLTHNHIIPSNPPNICDACQIVQSLTHIFVHCPKFESIRGPLIDYCTTQNKPFDINNLLNCQFPYNLLLKFLIISGMLKLI